MAIVQFAVDRSADPGWAVVELCKFQLCLTDNWEYLIEAFDKILVPGHMHLAASNNPLVCSQLYHSYNNL